MPIPITCVDNFYKDPDRVREWALTLPFDKGEGTTNYPGERTEYLNFVDKRFFDDFVVKLLSLFYNLDDNEVRCQCDTAFQKIYPYDADPLSSLNGGWNHLDDNDYLFAGVIYLSKDPSTYSGTTLVHPKIADVKKQCDFSVRNQLYAEGTVSKEEYAQKREEHNNQFEDSLVVGNRFNRLICYGNENWHRESSLYMEDQDFRLTQVFFVKNLEASSFPLHRITQHNL